MIVTELIYNTKTHKQQTIKRELTQSEINKRESDKNKYQAQQKIHQLTNWFDNYFDKQLIQSQWQDNFKVSHDDYFNKDYVDINELKEQAEIVRQEIKNLRETMLGVEEDV